MTKYIGYAFIAIMLTACGGGDPEDTGPTTHIQPVKCAASAPVCT